MRDGIEQGGFQPLALSFRFRLPELFHRSRAFDRDGDHGADRIHGLTRKRSEERRVGKECRCGWLRYPEKKRTDDPPCEWDLSWRAADPACRRMNRSVA